MESLVLSQRGILEQKQAKNELTLFLRKLKKFVDKVKGI